MPSNYMDKFDSAEAFIRSELLANRGTHNIVSRAELLDAVYHAAPPGNVDLSNATKAEIFDRLVELVGARAYTMYPVGVSSHCFQLKFGITHREVLKMANTGFLKATGTSEFRMYGRYCSAATYDPYQYYSLTMEEVHEWLDTHKRIQRKKKEEDNEATDPGDRE